jgi:hypothetical protein
MFLRLAVIGCACAVSGTPAAAQDPLAFRSPTGNIHCMIFAAPPAEARCDLIQAVVTFPRPRSCDLDWGHAFVVGSVGPGQPFCAGDTVAMPDAPVLHYGGSISHAGFTCRSETTGMTCENPQGRGFSLARARQRVF